MKKYVKEITIIIVQFLLFYLLPLTMNLIGPITMVLILIFLTLLLSFLLGMISKNKVKFLFPVLVTLIFIPSIFIYYNISALVHSIWYLVTSITGLSIGSFVNTFIK